MAAVWRIVLLERKILRFQAQSALQRLSIGLARLLASAIKRLRKAIPVF